MSIVKLAKLFKDLGNAEKAAEQYSQLLSLHDASQVLLIIARFFWFLVYFSINCTSKYQKKEVLLVVFDNVFTISLMHLMLLGCIFCSRSGGGSSLPRQSQPFLWAFIRCRTLCCSTYGCFCRTGMILLSMENCYLLYWYDYIKKHLFMFTSIYLIPILILLHSILMQWKEREAAKALLRDVQARLVYDRQSDECKELHTDEEGENDSDDNMALESPLWFVFTPCWAKKKRGKFYNLNFFFL